MEPRIIKTEEQYRRNLDEVARLAAEDPDLGTEDGGRLELLAKLVEDYEKDRFKFAKPAPVEAILFRMEQQGLRQKDLAPLFGGKNRVSEVLSCKRPLTLSMVRALTAALQIPAELLIHEPEPVDSETRVAEEEIPLRYIVDAGWLPDTKTRRPTTDGIAARYLRPPSGPLYLRRTITYGSSPETNKTNLWLWAARVRELAHETRRQRGKWQPDVLNDAFLAYVARLSWSEQGPRLAQEFLAEKGIASIVLPALPKTKLDGAAMRDRDGAPIVGLTLRHDRLDNFWFTLIHELAHAWKHLLYKDIAIIDESIEDSRDDDTKEAEANRLARDAFIPQVAWQRSDAFLHPSVETIRALADRLHISPAIVAGRLRHEKSGYRMFGQLIGNRQVRKHFPDVRWR